MLILEKISDRYSSNMLKISLGMRLSEIILILEISFYEHDKVIKENRVVPFLLFFSEVPLKDMLLLLGQ